MKKITLITIILGVIMIANAQENSENSGTDTVQFVPRNELKMTPEITEMLIYNAYWMHKNDSDEELSRFGIKDRSQLDNLHLGKPFPKYTLVNNNLKFLNQWNILVMSEDEPLFITTVRLMEDGRYRWAGSGSAEGARILYNYKHKDLIIGDLDDYPRSYLIIRKDNKDIFVEGYDYATQEYLKNEYSLNEVINHKKK